MRFSTPTTRPARKQDKFGHHPKPHAPRKYSGGRVFVARPPRKDSFDLRRRVTFTDLRIFLMWQSPTNSSACRIDIEPASQSGKSTCPVRQAFNPLHRQRTRPELLVHLAGQDEWVAVIQDGTGPTKQIEKAFYRNLTADARAPCQTAAETTFTLEIHTVWIPYPAPTPIS